MVAAAVLGALALSGGATADTADGGATCLASDFAGADFDGSATATSGFGLPDLSGSAAETLAVAAPAAAVTATGLPLPSTFPLLSPTPLGDASTNEAAGAAGGGSGGSPYLGGICTSIS